MDKKEKKPVSRDIVIPVMGPTGAGKSTFINALLKKESMTVGYGLTSCTSKLKAAIIDPLPGYPHLAGRRLVIVDTPGFDDTYKEDLATLGRIAEWLKNAYLKKHALGGVIYLHDITSDRLDAAAQKNLKIFHHLCGDDALNNVVLGTTKWSRDTGGIGAGHERELKDVHWKPMINKGSTVHRFSDDHASAWKFIDTILRRMDVNGTTLAIQKELVDEKKPISDTNAGREYHKAQGEKSEKSLFVRFRRLFGRS